MFFLTLQERVEIAQFVVKKTAGRIPVVVSGHISDDPHNELEELSAAADTGADAVVLVSNHFDPKNTGTGTFLGNLKWLLKRLPKDIALGMYECPYPYRRLLTDEELMFCADSGRFLFLKDVSCDLDVIKRRVALTKNSPMAIINANAAIAWDAMQAGSRGFNGVNTNFHPDLYRWLYSTGSKFPELARELAGFLVLAALSEAFGYPVLAKMYHQRIGIFSTIKSRAVTFDVRERFWALDPILDKIVEGTEMMRLKIEKAGT
jgi:4-hydroxy-tetrahydrodipicolinate synthase